MNKTKTQIRILILFLLFCFLQFIIVPFFGLGFSTLNLILIFTITLSYFSISPIWVFPYSILGGIVVDLCSGSAFFGFYTSIFVAISVLIYIGSNYFFRKKSLPVFLSFGILGLILFVTGEFIELTFFLNQKTWGQLLLQKDFLVYLISNLGFLFLIWYGDIFSFFQQKNKTA